MRYLALLAFVATTAVPAAAAAADFTVTNSGMTAYVINGVSNPPLTLVHGRTYTFDVNATGHPFFIKTAQVTGSGSTFDTGVTNNGVTVGTLTFTVPDSTPATLFYQCGVHAVMTNAITFGAGPVPATGPIGAVLLALALCASGFIAYRRLARA
jgi:hypothetical protein